MFITMELEVKTVIVGGGKGCRAILELAVEGRLSTISMLVLCVVDPNPDAPGMVYARGHNIATLTDLEAAARLPGLDLIIEVTGQDSVLESIYHLAPAGVRVMDHVLARVFWDVEQADMRLREELAKSLALEKQLEQDRLELQEILDAVPDVVMVINPDMRVERVNARFEQMTGIGKEEARGRPCYEVYCQVVEGERERDTCPFEEVVKTGRPVALIRYSPGGDGREESYFEVTANPVRDASGAIVRVVKTSRPITEQVLLKRETEQNEARFRQFLDAAHDLIVMKDVNGRCLYINRQAAAMMGKAPQDFIGRTDWEALPEKLARRVMDTDAKVMREKRHLAREERLFIEGKQYYLDTVRFPLLDYKGEVIGVASISRDITAQKSLQKELIQSERLAAVGKLAAGVAHEINNPLTGILTFTEGLLLDSEPDDPRREDYQTIMRETMRCRQIVRDLLDYSRAEKPRRERADLNRIVERAVALVAKQAEFHDVRFEYDLSPGLPPVSVDQNQIQQVILNLVINAKDAMNKVGTIRLATGAEADGKMTSLSISDTGCGIAPDKLKVIFEPFYTSKGAEGNGLGLPVVLSIIEQHGGEVKVESEPGKGSTFRVRLPRAEAAPVEEKG